jgi:uncharacterized protein YjiS (DUF1127 family)
MWSKRAPVPHRAGGVRIAGRILGLVWLLELALDVRRERKMLLGMDDLALKDIGLSRSDAWAEGSRSLWDIPGERL